jgi:MFS family permease
VAEHRVDRVDGDRGRREPRWAAGKANDAGGAATGADHAGGPAGGVDRAGASGVAGGFSAAVSVGDVGALDQSGGPDRRGAVGEVAETDALARAGAIGEAGDGGMTWRAQLAVAAIFFVNGAMFANWVARVPAVKDHVGAGPGALGLALLGLAGGSLVTMPLAGRLCERIGSDTAVLASGLAASLALSGPALAPNARTLGVALAVYGGAFGLLDVAMNVQAVAVVRRVGRPIMPWFHAAFSLGGLAGAATGALAAGIGLSLLAHFLLASAASAAVVLSTWRHLLPDSGAEADDSPDAARRAAAGELTPEPARRDGWAESADLAAGVSSAGPDRVATHEGGEVAGPDREGAEHSAGHRPWRRSQGMPGRRNRLFLAGLGAIAACAAMGEGAMADWTALFLRDVTDAGAGVAALGFAAFSITMTAGRLGGEAAIRRLGAVRVLRLGGTAATTGVLLAVVTGSAAAGLVGFGLVGLGFSCAFPLALTTAGESSDGSGGSEIAAVSVIGYLGFLVGPPLIGLLAEAVELRAAVLAVAGPTLGLVALAGVVGRNPPADGGNRGQPKHRRDHRDAGATHLCAATTQHVS